MNNDLTGYCHYFLTVLRKAEYGREQWVCKCKCGNVVTLPRCKILINKSCGCLEKLNRQSIGQRTAKHNKTNTRLFSIWSGIKSRCNNPNTEHYDRYGGRGISICEEWENNFTSFYDWSVNNGYADHLSIDRKDVNGNYEPNNCKWSTNKEQAQNKENTLYVNCGSYNMTASEFSKQNCIDYDYIKRKIKKGYDAETIIKYWNILHNHSEDNMTVKEAASYYNVSIPTIRNWIKKGKLKSQVIEKRVYIIGRGAKKK